MITLTQQQAHIHCIRSEMQHTERLAPEETAPPHTSALSLPGIWPPSVPLNKWLVDQVMNF